MSFHNCYQDLRRSQSYATLEFPGTYYLAYRDLPRIIALHCTGTAAIDVGCGTGRSTRFLQRLGFHTIGVDISQPMLNMARELDPCGCYQLVAEGDFSPIADGIFDLALAVSTFDNVPTEEKKVKLLQEIGRVVSSNGRCINLVSDPAVYLHEWASFSTQEFPENRTAKSGERVRIVMKDVADQRPVEDVLWSDESYREVFVQASLEVEAVYRPLARDEEPCQWITETRIPPWTIYVLRHRVTGR